MTSRPRITLLALVLIVAGCASPSPQPPSSSHLQADNARTPAGAIPAPVQNTLSLPPPKPIAKAETYSVVVNHVQVHDLLFALARDARLNVDIHPGIEGTVTLNAIDQTLPQILTRIAKQVDMRFELDGPNLAVMPDTPFLRTYKVDYVNLSRDSSGTVSASSQIATNTPGSGGGSAGSSGNGSLSKVDYQARNHFWESLDKNIKDLLRETDKILPEGSSETVTEQTNQQQTTGTGAALATATKKLSEAIAGSIAGSPNPAALQTQAATTTRRNTFREAASVITNPEAGILSVRATSRQHEKIQEFLDAVMASARRQVLIEATIVEVDLSDRYRQGIEWSRLRADGSGFSVRPSALTGTPAPFTLNILDRSNPLNLTLALSLLEQFGDVKVLSSPKISVLNNQSAILKVVENAIYFTVKSDIAPATVAGGQPTKAITTTPQSVSVGLVMLVTPQISENDSITLNVRPSITSISSFVQDPNPDIPANIGNAVPQIKTREMESVMRVSDGEIAVLGGLMQEKADYNTGRVPGVGRVPLIGELFSRRDNVISKSELVIFLRPVVIRDPSVAGDYRSLKSLLPDGKFFTPPPEGVPFGNVRQSTGGGQ